MTDPVDFLNCRLAGLLTFLECLGDQGAQMLGKVELKWQKFPQIQCATRGGRRGRLTSFFGHSLVTFSAVW